MNVFCFFKQNWPVFMTRYVGRYFLQFTHLSFFKSQNTIPCKQWFLWCDEGEKPLRANERFSIEHARIMRHAPDATTRHHMSLPVVKTLCQNQETTAFRQQHKKHFQNRWQVFQRPYNKLRWIFNTVVFYSFQDCFSHLHCALAFYQL